MLKGNITIKGIEIQNAAIKILGYEGVNDTLVVKYGIFSDESNLNRSSALEVREIVLDTTELIKSILESQIQAAHPEFQTIEN